MLTMKRKQKAKKAIHSDNILFNPEKVFGGSQDGKGDAPRDKKEEESQQAVDTSTYSTAP